jgi:hypothetical protein
MTSGGAGGIGGGGGGGIPAGGASSGLPTGTGSGIEGLNVLQFAAKIGAGMAAGTSGMFTGDVQTTLAQMASSLGVTPSQLLTQLESAYETEIDDPSLEGPAPANGDSQTQANLQNAMLLQTFFSKVTTKMASQLAILTGFNDVTTGKNSNAAPADVTSALDAAYNSTHPSGGNPWFGPNGLVAMMVAMTQLSDAYKQQSVEYTQIENQQRNALADAYQWLASLYTQQGNIQAAQDKYDGKMAYYQMIGSFVGMLGGVGQIAGSGTRWGEGLGTGAQGISGIINNAITGTQKIGDATYATRLAGVQAFMQTGNMATQSIGQSLQSAQQTNNSAQDQITSIWQNANQWQNNYASSVKI